MQTNLFRIMMVLRSLRKFNERYFCFDYRKAVQGESAPAGERQLRSTPDWGEGAINGDHLWVPTSASGDLCYVGDSECQVSD